MSFRRITVTCAVLCMALLLSVARAECAQSHQPPGQDAHQSAAKEGHQPVKEGAAAEGHTAEGEHQEGWMPTVARVANFAILVGLLTYFLRSPIAGYLASRGEQIRAELVSAADMRRTAEAQLAEVNARMAALPGELEALSARGGADIAAEEARIRAAAEADRDRLLEHMHRDVEMQVRIARRTLMEEAATLATEIARRRIQTTITPEDQMRLLDRYTRQLGTAR